MLPVKTLNLKFIYLSPYAPEVLPSCTLDPVLTIVASLIIFPAADSPCLLLERDTKSVVLSMQNIFF
jgi:hypothetical protein